MNASLAKDGFDVSELQVGRMGHGLGLQLTEWPSLIVGWDIAIEAGTVLTLEPSLEVKNGGGDICHEENLVVTEDGYELLSKRAPREIVRINCK